MARGAGTLFFYPHSDDMCIACTYILTRGFLLRPWALATIFSQSYHLANRTKVDYPFEVIPEIRQAEDISFCRAFGMRYLPLGFEDKEYNPVEGRAITEQVADSLGRILRYGTFSVVVCSYVGLTSENFHPHHKIVVEAAAATISRMSGITLLFTDDQPYSRIPLDAEIICNGNRYVPTIFELSRADLKHKIEMMGLYKSQMCKEYFSAVERSFPGDVQNRYSESLWIPESSFGDGFVLKALIGDGSEGSRFCK